MACRATVAFGPGLAAGMPEMHAPGGSPDTPTRAGFLAILPQSSRRTGSGGDVEAPAENGDETLEFQHFAWKTPTAIRARTASRLQDPLRNRAFWHDICLFHAGRQDVEMQTGALVLCIRGTLVMSIGGAM